MTWYLKAKEPEYNINHIWMYETRQKALKEYYYLINILKWDKVEYPTQEE